jgi:hypothetical protein
VASTEAGTALARRVLDIGTTVTPASCQGEVASLLTSLDRVATN